MRLKRIHLDNYRRFKESDLEFPDGVVGIIGSNGAGKSTLMEAIAWALFGTDASRTSKDQIKSGFAGKGDACRVILDFETNGDNYQVVRELRGASHSMDASVIINKKVSARGNTAVNELIQRTLDMDFRAFMTSFYAKQRELNALSDFQPYKRKELLARMLGIENVDRGLRKLRTDKKELELKLDLSRSHLKSKDELIPKRKEKAESLSSIAKGLRVAQEKLDSEKSSLKEKEKLWQDFKAKYDQLVGLRQKKSIIQGQKEGLEAQLKSLQEEKAQLVALEPERKNLEQLLAPYEQIKQNLSLQDQLQAKSEHRKATEKQMKEAESSLAEDRKRLASLEKELQSRESLKERLLETNSKLQSIERELEKERGRYVNAEASLKSLADEAKRLESQLENVEKLGPDSVCDRCLRPMGSDYHKIREHLLEERKRLEERVKPIEAERVEIKNKGQNLKEKKQALEVQKESLQKSMEELSRLEGERQNLGKGVIEKENTISSLRQALGELGEVGYDPISHGKLKKQVEHLEKLKQRSTEVASELKRLPQLEEKLTILRQKIEQVSKETIQVEKAIADLKFSEEEYRKIESEMEENRKTAHSAELSLKEIEHRVQLLQKEVEQLEKEIKETGQEEENIKTWQEQQRYLEKLDLLFSDFRVSLIGRIRPTLSRHAKSLFLELTDNRYEDLELSEDYEIYIYDRGEKFPIERFSGGETDLANLCLRIAISLLISESSQVGYSFIILDEIFGSQDMVRKENILNALARLRNRFAQIFLITHIDDIKDSVENLIYVTENEDGTSELVLQ